MLYIQLGLFLLQLVPLDLSLPTSASCLTAPRLVLNIFLFSKLAPFASSDILQLPQHPLDLPPCAGISGIAGIQYWAPFPDMASGVSDIV